MARGLYTTQSKFIVLSGFLILMIIAGLSGCSPIPQTASVSQPIAICTPDSPAVNIYKSTPQTWVNTIFQYAYPLIPTPIPPDLATPTPPNEPQILAARYEAFQYLKSQTKRWSDTEVIKLNDLNEIQLTITFISPELIQATFLSEVLRDRFLTSDFDVQLQNVLNSIAARDELLFLVTVTATNNNSTNSTPHVINIPIDQMILNNAGNLKYGPIHDDHNLEQPINSSLEPVFGYIAYPLALLKSDVCNLALDPKYDTSIVITVSDIKIDGDPSRPYTWTIPYKSLIEANIPPQPPTFKVPDNLNQDLMSPLPKPPYPMTSLILSNGINPDIYWHEFAQYVWHQVTLGNY